MPDVFVAGLVVEGRRCVVIGGSDDAAARCTRLLEAGAHVELFATSLAAATQRVVDEGQVRWTARDASERDTEDAFLVIDTRRDEALARSLAERARTQKFLLSCIDVPAHSTVTNVGVVRRGPFQIAIATGGESPALAATIRAATDAQLGWDLAGFTRELGALRAATPSSERRETIARALEGFSWRITYDLPKPTDARSTLEPERSLRPSDHGRGDGNQGSGDE